MSAVYIAIARQPGGFVSDTNTPEPLPTIVVHVDDALKETGIVTARGVPIYRVPERVPLGFCRDG